LRLIKIFIGETPSGTASFSYECSSANNVNFTNTSTLCNATNSWNFDDPLSAQNNSTQANPTHLFAAAGTHHVTLTVTDGNIISSVTQDITILSVSAEVNTPVFCHGAATGVISAKVSGGATVSFLWNTNPPQTTNVVKDLPAGNYSVKVSPQSGCDAVASITLTEPPALHIDFTISNATCNNANGSVTANVSGGVAPYNYIWSPVYSSSPMLQNVDAGNYTITVKDNYACSITSTAVVETRGAFSISLGNDTTICAGSNFIISPGNNFFAISMAG